MVYLFVLGLFFAVASAGKLFYDIDNKNVNNKAFKVTGIIGLIMLFASALMM